MMIKANSQQKEIDRTRGQLKGVVVILLTAFILLLISKGCEAAKNSYPEPPRTLIEDSIPKTVDTAAKLGWVPCPGNCLKLATPGWHHQVVEGHSDTDIWFTFRYSDGWYAYSQNHIGHIIRTYSDRPAEDIGICPVC